MSAGPSSGSAHKPLHFFSAHRWPRPPLVLSVPKSLSLGPTPPHKTELSVSSWAQLTLSLCWEPTLCSGDSFLWGRERGRCHSGDRMVSLC